MECARTNRQATKRSWPCLPLYYPMAQMNPQDIPSYQKAIRQIIKLERRAPPQFLHHEIRNGGLIVTCATDYDKQWLVRHIDRVKFRYRLQVDDPIALEYRFLIEGEVINLKNTKDNILHKIRCYNSSIILGDWKIIKDEMNHKKMTRTITFEVAYRSIKCLEQLKNRLRLDEYGIDGITFGRIRRIKRV
ncbi:uncharacterized protein LOC113465064 [Ceratina calcarata]|uniref:Uncharacterized protein LOC113465064 n=1 Tax=Ceratina calcarata TaxID=156304 RepID=A0AAJ7SB72_9HYME|nr:uncharacterized protein LOC113465064 [Ceratina calcarata]